VVKFWFDLYDGPQFKDRLPGAPFRPTAKTQPSAGANPTKVARP